MSYCDKAAAAESRLNALISQAGPVLATTGVADVTTTGSHVLGSLPVAGGAIAGSGETYEIDAAGYFGTGAAAPTLMQFTVTYGAVLLWTANIPAAGLLAGASGDGWRVRGTVCWDAIFAVPEANAAVTIEWHTAPGLTGSASWFSVQSLAGIDTSATHDLALAFAFTTTSTVDLSCKFCHICRKG